MAAGHSAVNLHLHVHSANGLSQKDIFGYSDPYVVINTEPRDVDCPWEPSSRSVKTKTCKKTLDPVWDEHFTLKFDPVEEFVVLDVFDENRITRDDFLGRVILTYANQFNIESPARFSLKKRSERSNVTGTILLGIDFTNLGSDNSNDEEEYRAEDEDTDNFKEMFYKIIEKDNLKTQLGIIASEGVQRLKISVNRAQVNIKFHRERSELALPFTTDYQILRKIILQFFFDSANIIEGSFQDAFKGAVEKVFQDRAMARRLKEKFNIQTRSEFDKIDLKLEIEPIGRYCEIRYISKYKTLILTATAWRQWMNRTVEQQSDQIFAALRDLLRREDQDRIAQQFEDQLSSSRGQFGEEGPALPPGWDWRRDQNGRMLYLDHNNQRTTFDRPQVASAPESLPEVASYRRTVSHEDESQWVPHQAEDEDGGVTNDEEGSLPPDWEMRYTRDGRPFYVDHRTSTTTWVCPDKSTPMSQLNFNIGVLPQGWEEKVLPNGKIFYVDHNSKRTTWEDPRFSMTGIS